MPLETEIKIRVSELSPVRRRLRDLGFRVHTRRLFERNTLYDFPDHRLSNRGELIRIRETGRETLLTYKGPPQNGPHKSREEIETSIGSAAALQEVLAHIGLTPSFRYEKYRAEYIRAKGGIVTIDETPIGDYVEIEGEPSWIDATAAELGYSPTEYITESYGALYAQHCRERGIQPSHMVVSDSDAAKSGAPQVNA